MMTPLTRDAEGFELGLSPNTKIAGHGAYRSLEDDYELSGLPSRTSWHTGGSIATFPFTETSGLASSAALNPELLKPETRCQTLS